MALAPIIRKTSTRSNAFKIGQIEEKEVSFESNGLSPRGEEKIMSGRSFKLKTIEEILGNSPKKLEVGCIELTEDSDAEIISKNKKSMLGMLRT